MLPHGLAAFHAVVQAGSIRKASAALGLAPSSISRQVAILEQQIGTRLLERSVGGVALTHAGTLVADFAKSMVFDFEALQADLNDLRGTRRRLIRISAVESIVSGGPLEAVEAFRRRFESVSFALLVTPAPQVLDAVTRGECDVGVAFCALPHPDIITVASIPEPIVLVTQPDHPLGGRPVSLGDLRDYPVALPDTNFGVRRIFDQACVSAGLAVVPALSSNAFEALRDFVRCGAGIAVLPLRAVTREQELGRLISSHISEPSLNGTTIDIIIRKRRMPRIVRLFVEELAREISEHAPPGLIL